ncbi:DNA invertase Pin-like site-specific DNA recombinase [Ruminiclostridium sufflavum DSM 19573]|uniref:DNA invertase Pin-like site-specific DNA recombinase n=1 Tax=Ruminiclostridium sufflavum DSM 19573 TaxID=1121337 RepID=A0A318XKY8_9FIRM|nr:recombinase family protein [Ruminiclostridium sufflavum]PYG86652.1 DNA invertase Pin-like site-specific DNA recombinase [Ruminiclostridium sufflavum DSM 19573]
MDAVYARQSVDKKDSISIESQIEFCKKEIANTDYKIYTDKGYSGANTNRPAFEEMINDVKMGNIERVVVYKLDRISRSLLDFAHIIEVFNKYKVEFISQTEKFDTSTSIGRAMLSIVMVFAQLERETIQQRVKDNYYQRGKSGLYLGGTAPFGYNKADTLFNGKKTCMFEENEEQAGFVRKIYDMYLYNNKSFTFIAKEINTKYKFKTNMGNNWSACAVGRLIRNPVYAKADADVYVYLKSKGAVMNNDISDFTGENGCFVYGERKNVSTGKFTNLANNFVTVALHKGIISSEQWLKCQYKADEGIQLKNSGRGTYTWLSGLMKCGYCGYAVTAVKSRNKNIAYINCGGRKNGFCNERKRVIHLKDIEQIAETKLLDKIKTLNSDFDFEINSDSKQANELKIKLAKVEEDIRKLVDSLLMLNEVSGRYINEKILELDKKKKLLLKQINKITMESSSEKINKRDIGKYLKNWADYKTEQKKNIARTLIKEVIITDEQIEIIFKI